MNKKRKSIFLNHKGQVLTEYLFVVMILVFLVLTHITLCVGFITRSLMEYASFMGARSEMVQKATASRYVDNMAETLSPLAKVTPPAQGSYVVQRQNGADVVIDYGVQSMVPIFQSIIDGLKEMKSASPVKYQPSTDTTRGKVFDNE